MSILDIGHVVPAAQLAVALGWLAEGSKVIPNAMGNLGVLDQAGDYVGYIDLGEDCNVILFEEPGDES